MFNKRILIFNTIVQLDRFIKSKVAFTKGAIKYTKCGKVT